MEKDRRPNWKETNVALIGSELDHQVKKAAAEGEPQWVGIGKQVELRVWRIEQFRVVPWPRSKYGKFHEGDSYIVLNSFLEAPGKPKLLHDVHMWIGQESSQDEYGTAAYKMVECDEILDGAAVQHREVQGEESSMFLKYFGGRITVLKGGVASGFNHVEASPVDPHLYRLKGQGDSVQLTQVQVRRDELNAGDVFILDTGRVVYQWTGAEANRFEKLKGAEVLKDVAGSRGAKSVVLEQGQNDGETEAKDFWKHLPGERRMLGLIARKVDVKTAEQGGSDAKVQRFTPVLFCLGGARGPSRVGSARTVTVGGARALRLRRTWLDSRRVLLLDNGFHIYVWQGKGAPSGARAAAVHQAQEYLRSYRRPEMLPITVVKEGQGDRVGAFSDAFYEDKRGLFSWLFGSCYCGA
eukprot:TRINITY_DN20021_c0_g2_i1.p1 TRINITY_DN20021_c0_g2~~TRINITY_DN20021_c0_g2_i1.p1  ORF type:complete len:422 (-),score=92.31 TRINITY_DN20021_c0_g2_i1:62-1291(-)